MSEHDLTRAHWEGVQEGRAQERARIVAWLRHRTDSLAQRVPLHTGISTLVAIADVIEAGVPDVA